MEHKALYRQDEDIIVSRRTTVDVATSRTCSRTQAVPRNAPNLDLMVGVEGLRDSCVHGAGARPVSNRNGLVLGSAVAESGTRVDDPGYRYRRELDLRIPVVDSPCAGEDDPAPVAYP